MGGNIEKDVGFLEQDVIFFSHSCVCMCVCVYLVAQLRKNHLQCGRPGFSPWFGKIPWRRERLPIPVFWPGEFHGLYSPWGDKESDTTERLSLSLSSTVCAYMHNNIKIQGPFVHPDEEVNICCYFLVTKSCLTFCNPMDCSPPGYPVHGIILARILEWVAISFSRGSSRPRDRTSGLQHCRQTL